MGALDLVLQSSSSVSLLGALVVLLLVYIVSSFSFSSQENRKGPPGPKPLPLLGNLLLLDLKRPYNTLVEVQQELSKTIGSRRVQVEDRKNLPFTDAVIHETQRLASIVPIISHPTSRDVAFQGHFIKKGTTVIPLLTSVLHDESEWEEPHSFHPAHFLDKEWKFIKREAFMPFSAGRRVCVGESLARMELFIFFTSLLQHFCFTPPAGVSEEELDLTSRVGFSLHPSPHTLCAVSCM